MPSRFEPPRRQFPANGPFTREELADLTNEQLNNIPVTKANVHQLAFFCDPISPSRLRTHFCSLQLDARDIIQDSLRRDYFRNWATQDLDKIKLLAQHFKLVTYSGEAFAYIPQVYWVDEKLGKAVRSGPFFVQCKRDGFNCHDMRTMSELGYPISDPKCDRWRRMEHPHMHDGSVCLGTESAAYFNNADTGDLYALMETFEGLIQIYNPGDPHRHFNDEFQGQVIVDEPEKVPSLAPDGSGIYLAYVYKEWEDNDLTEVKVAGMNLVLSPQEIKSIKRAHPDYVRSCLMNNLKDYLPHYIRGTCPEKERLFFDRALPAGDSVEDRIAKAGITITPGFNMDDEDMEATYTPYTKEHGLDFTDYDNRQAEEAQNAEQAESEETEDSSETQATPTDSVEAEQRPEPVRSDTF